MYQQLKTVICIGLYGIKYTMASAFSNIVCFCSELRLSNNYSNSYSENKTLGEIDQALHKLYKYKSTFSTAKGSGLRDADLYYMNWLSLNSQT